MTDDTFTAQAHVLEAEEATVTVQDHHIRIQRTGSHRVIELPMKDVRRIQIDLEERRPAVLVIVPHTAEYEPESLRVPQEQLEALSVAMLHLAIDINDTDLSRTSHS
jgi:hypothetical protein